MMPYTDMSQANLTLNTHLHQTHTMAPLTWSEEGWTALNDNQKRLLAMSLFHNNEDHDRKQPDYTQVAAAAGFKNPSSARANVHKVTTTYKAAGAEPGEDGEDAKAAESGADVKTPKAAPRKRKAAAEKETAGPSKAKSKAKTAQPVAAKAVGARKSARGKAAAAATATEDEGEDDAAEKEEEEVAPKAKRGRKATPAAPVKKEPKDDEEEGEPMEIGADDA
ncbi:hypothetical protein K402DRAFT_216753 [Aulographum hederae CBS 113979]|uniref:Uncharacterized protein n=1 Tax=Aulographum hederae CBS 113979 TaxID=1176131 RepID=A0A6G1GMM4_9PEZI|nr:hypothetical protein K402DRAFT_216753 [Aulographum hederae CBS 113979]